MDTLDVFYPERMAQRILGMGDITTLVEKAQEQFDEEQAKKLERRSAKTNLILPISKPAGADQENGKYERPAGNDSGCGK